MHQHNMLPPRGWLHGLRSTDLDEFATIVDSDQTILNMHDWHLIVAFLALRNLTLSVGVERLTQRLQIDRLVIGYKLTIAG